MGAIFPRGSSRLNFEPIVYLDGRKRRNVFSPASYAKGKVLFRLERPPAAAGEMRWKTPGQHFAETVGGRYTGREDGYILSPTAAEKLLRYLQTEDAPSSVAKHEGGSNPRVSRSVRDMTLKARVNALVGRGKK